MNRYELLKLLYPIIKNELVICNIGIPSQELYDLGDRDNFFYMLGSMGLSSSIGLGLALSTDKKVIALDGDGSILMNLGSLSTIANLCPQNYLLIILDNGTYGSTGDQPTFSQARTSIAGIAKSAGCLNVIECDARNAFENVKATLSKLTELTIMVIKINPGNTSVKPIPLNPVYIRERFRKIVLS